MFTKIVVPLDGSELAEAILPSVCALAKCTGGEILLLRVVRAPVVAYAGDFLVDERIEEITESEATAYLTQIAADLEKEHLNVSLQVVNGLAADTILDFAARSHADLIAMSTHGRGGFPRLFLGSVADEIVRNSEIPVLLVRSKTTNSSHSH